MVMCICGGLFDLFLFVFLKNREDDAAVVMVLFACVRISERVWFLYEFETLVLRRESGGGRGCQDIGTLPQADTNTQSSLSRYCSWGVIII